MKILTILISVQLFLMNIVLAIFVWMSVQTYQPLEFYDELDDAVYVENGMVNIYLRYCKLVDVDSTTTLYLHTADGDYGVELASFNGSSDTDCNENNPSVVDEKIPLPSIEGAFYFESVTPFPAANSFAQPIEVRLVSKEFVL